MRILFLVIVVFLCFALVGCTEYEKSTICEKNCYQSYARDICSKINGSLFDKIYIDFSFKCLDNGSIKDDGWRYISVDAVENCHVVCEDRCL